MDELKLAYLAGVKVGIESLVEGLKITAEKNGNISYLSNLSNWSLKMLSLMLN